MVKQQKFAIKFTQAKNTDNATYYTIQVFDIKENKSWIFKSRYSQMRDIHQNCQKIAKSNEMPQFPPKKLFGSKSQQFIQQRKKQLENYYNTLLKTINVDKFPELLSFFNTNRPKQEIKQQTKIKQEVKLPPKQSKNMKKVLQQITNDTIHKLVDISNDFYEEIEEDSKNRLFKETEHKKFNVQSQILSSKNISLLKSDKQNQFNFWSMFFNDTYQKFISDCQKITEQIKTIQENKHIKQQNIKFVIAL